MAKDGNGSQPRGLPHHIVGIGASAGGLEAIESLVANIPPEAGIGYVIVQHLSPDYRSMMVELLSKRTRIPVATAGHNTPVAPDTIYVIPPKHNISIENGVLLLSDQDHSRGLNLPIDIFFRSLAEDQAERAVGIVLSGTGSDGMRGVRSIKAAGGLVMVQSIETAKFDGMPASAISTGVADSVLAPEEMADRLIAWIRHPYVTRSEDSSALQSNEQYLLRIFELVQERHGINFAYYKMTTVMRRLERRITVSHAANVTEYLRHLEHNPREITALYREFLIGVTSFFRDPEAFDALRASGLEGLIANRRGDRLRVWVPACSTGEEAYSLAILIDQILLSNEVSCEVKIFATDIDADSVAVAAAGRYPESIAADVPPEVLSRYFHKDGDTFQIVRAIRDYVVFAQHNLVNDPPFTHIDLVSCRNLLIYLQPVLQRKVLELFNFALNSGGFLFLGTSESVGEMQDFFEPTHHRYRVYRSKGRRTPGVSLEINQPPEWTRAGQTVLPYVRSSRTTARSEDKVLARFVARATGDYIPPAVVVNDRYELQHVVGDVADYLQLPDGRMLNDVTKMGRSELAIPLATGLQKALGGQSEVNYTGIPFKTGDGAARRVRVRFLRLPDRTNQDPLVAIFFEEEQQPESVGADGQVAPYDLDGEMHERLRELEQELQFTRENLQATIEELETSNEELQATNEELLASNEELQSTNEELQAANEEIHTVNAENQARIIELTNLTNDLENLLVNSDIGKIVLDENLEIRLLSRNIPSLTNILPKDVGRSIKDLRFELGDVNIAAIAEGVNAKHTDWEDRLSTADGKSLLVRIRPYSVGPDSYSGVLITLVDITELQDALKNLAVTDERLETAFQGAGVAWWDWDRATGSVAASPQKFAMLGYSSDEISSSVDDWIARIHPEDREAAMAAMRHTLTGESDHYECTYRLKAKDGSWLTFRDWGTVTNWSDAGEATRLIGSVRRVDDG